MGLSVAWTAGVVHGGLWGWGWGCNDSILGMFWAGSAQHGAAYAYPACSAHTKHAGVKSSAQTMRMHHAVQVGGAAVFAETGGLPWARCAGLVGAAVAVIAWLNLR